MVFRRKTIISDKNVVFVRRDIMVAVVLLRKTKAFIEDLFRFVKSLLKIYSTRQIKALINLRKFRYQ